MFHKQIVVDAKGHLLGRLASVIAKQLLLGQKVAVVRCEKILISGSLFRNKVKFQEWLNKAMMTNHRRGHHHYRSPSRFFYKSLRAMLPRYLKKGEAALSRLKVFEGIPSPYDHMKRMVVPSALKASMLKPYRPFTILGELCSLKGWGKKELVESLEDKREKKSTKFYDLKKKRDLQRKKIENSASLKAINEKLKQYGY